MKLWEGRFSKGLDASADSFNSSVMFDRRMFAEDITASSAHAKMLEKCGIISAGDAEAIVRGLSGIMGDITDGTLIIDEKAEDIHTFIESELTARIGDSGKRLHTARSRNDQVATDLRMYLRNETIRVIELLSALMRVILETAKRHTRTVMPGYTHLQRAQPITFGHYLTAYAQMFLRDTERLADAYKRVNVMPLGSGALAGTTYPIDRDFTCGLLGFDEPCLNSIDGVSDRDYCVELAADLAIVMMHLSRLAEEIILFSSWEFKFIELDDAYSTGSSIMPQKKNPDVAELVRGKTGRVFGGLISLLTMLKGLPMAYNKDMQEDKEAVFDSFDTVKACLPPFTQMIETMTVLSENMRAAAAKGFINATDCADYLTKKGVPFRDAYKVVGRLVAYCQQNGLTLETLSIEEYRKFHDLFDQCIYTAIDLDNCVEKRTSAGGPSPSDTVIRISQTLQKIERVEALCVQYRTK